MAQAIYRARFEVPAEELFAWHERPGALERLLPPWSGMRVLERQGTIRNGDRAVLQLRLGPLRVRWVALHRGYEPGRRFADEQVEGPFASWFHEHRFLPEGPHACTLEDRIRYREPAGWLGRAVAGSWVRRELERTFAWRAGRLRAELERHRRARAALGGRSLRVLVSGAGGLIGRELCPFLTAGGHAVRRLVHGAPPGPLPGAGGEAFGWDALAGRLDPQAFDAIDAVVHLAGEPIAAGRWTAERKRRIRQSRVEGTRAIAEALAALARPPRVLVCASAIGWYGDRPPAEPLEEASPPGTGFLAEVCRAWEEAAEPARRAGIRVVQARLGVVLSGRGGALGRMLPAFRLGLGGPIGSGRQIMSWVHIDDAVGALYQALWDERLAGPVNVTAPVPVSNRAFARTLGRVLGRPAALGLPAPVVRWTLGQLGEELLLAGARVLPRRLEEAGFAFAHPELEGALRAETGRLAPGGRSRQARRARRT
ncbi:MAG: hypothetical protein KatS3mg102_0209 [Planctomycetota bacterium]|nr:MAG: hypothetical protein KatS3mg102_0209 [Planctomycetota bacterium]